MKKCFILIFLIAGLIFNGSMSFTVQAPPEWALPALENLESFNLITETFYADFDKRVTRAEFAYLGVKLYEALSGEVASVGEDKFIDTNDQWVLMAKNHGLVNGYSDGTFKPDQAIRRDELAALFVNVLKASQVNFASFDGELFTDDASIEGWAKEAVYIAKANGIITGTGSNQFAGASNATILQSMLMFNNVISNKEIATTIGINSETSEFEDMPEKNDEMIDSYTQKIELSQFIGKSPNVVYDELKPFYNDNIIISSFPEGATYVSIGKRVNGNLSQEIAFFSMTGESINHIWIGFNTLNDQSIDLSHRLETINGVSFGGSTSEILQSLGITTSDLNETRNIMSLFDVIGYVEELGEGRSWRVEFLEDMSMLFGMGIYN